MAGDNNTYVTTERADRYVKKRLSELALWSIELETDVTTLQRLVRENYKAHLKAVDRLRKARRQLHEARQELARLKNPILRKMT